MPDPSPWWAPHVHADRRPFLTARGRVMAALRQFFREQDFAEVEAAVLQVSPGNEAHLHAFATDLIGPDGQGSRLYLHTSPEFACQEAAGRRRAPNLRLRPRIPQPRARRAAPSRIHPAGVVPGGRAV